MRTFKLFLRFLVGCYSERDYILLGRHISQNGHRGGTLLNYIFHHIGRSYHLEIPNWGNIGKNLVLAHPFGITVNPAVVIGDGCVLFKNCTIGSVRSGKRAGFPMIGNNCVVGCGAFVCGGITIGNDVLICANAFVDFDVPDHSIVIGNPGVIHHKENATADYNGLKGY